MSTSPTQRTLKFCRDQGWRAQVVEKWNPHSKTRLDLFGVIDIVALSGAIIGIQATSGPNLSSRVQKILASEAALDWVRAGGKLEAWGWAKRGAHGARKTWTARRVRFAVCGDGLVDTEVNETAREE